MTHSLRREHPEVVSMSRRERREAERLAQAAAAQPISPAEAPASSRPTVSGPITRDGAVSRRAFRTQAASSASAQPASPTRQEPATGHLPAAAASGARSVRKTAASNGERRGLDPARSRPTASSRQHAPSAVATPGVALTAQDMPALRGASEPRRQPSADHASPRGNAPRSETPRPATDLRVQSPRARSAQPAAVREPLPAATASPGAQASRPPRAASSPQRPSVSRAPQAPRTPDSSAAARGAAAACKVSRDEPASVSQPPAAAARPSQTARDAFREEAAPRTGGGIPVPRSFLRNEQELRPVKTSSSRSKVVRVRRSERRPVRRTTTRGNLLRGGAGVTAVGFAASVAIASTMPANAASTTISEDTAAEANLMTGAQGLAVSGSAPQGQYERAESFAVATLGTATAANLAANLPDAGAYRNDLTGTVQWPFPVGVKITDFFGNRVAPCASCSSDHKGVDFAPAEGTPIGAIASGRVIKTQLTDGGGLGVYVEVEHFIDGERVVSVYGHMLTGSISVKVGQVVNVGDELGKVGNTGSSTGAHLHLEVHIGGGVKIDPKAFIEAKNKPTTQVARPDATTSA